jgi:hypothetical protein
MSLTLNFKIAKFSGQENAFAIIRELVLLELISAFLFFKRMLHSNDSSSSSSSSAFSSFLF